MELDPYNFKSTFWSAYSLSLYSLPHYVNYLALCAVKYYSIMSPTTRKIEEEREREGEKEKYRKREINS
jgi:hypothetical protein